MTSAPEPQPAGRFAHLTEGLNAALGRLLPQGEGGDLALAVSGGSDSLALMHLVADWASQPGEARPGEASRGEAPQSETGGKPGPAPRRRLHVVTVDHGLRPAAAFEAAEVARAAAALGLPHSCLHWDGQSAKGNVMDAARRARYGLMADWASQRGIAHILLGHTADDLAETFLMRLSREAGVDGLSAMVPRFVRGGVAFLRPLLGAHRAELRAYLAARDIAWVDDPTNSDMAHARSRARAALEALAPLGITAQSLARSSAHLAEARHALNWYAFTGARAAVRLDRGDLLISQRQMRILPPEVQRRLLTGALKWISNAEYPPRRHALGELMAAVQDGRDMALHGCRAVPGRGSLRGWVRLCRDPRALKGLCCKPCEVWDGRWRVTGPLTEGAVLTATGREGLMRIDGWREAGLPEPAAEASPAIWLGGDLLAAPLLGHGSAAWRAEPLRGEDSFYNSFLSN